MTQMIERYGLKVADVLAGFVEDEVLPQLGIEAGAFWAGAADIFARFAPENRALLDVRNRLQAEIDAWHEKGQGQPYDAAAYETFLRRIGYLVPEPAAFCIDTQNVDEELARLAGPQLVVPVLNARFLLNAANARWGSLYDALYGTDALGEPRPGPGYDAARGAQVVARARVFLDAAIPLASGSHAGVTGWSVKDGALVPALAEPSAFVGYRGEPTAPRAVLLRHNGLHIELLIDRSHRVGKDDPAGVADVLLEAALSTIVDLEDSVAAVDAEDKVAAYRNWLGLMRGDLEARFDKGGRTFTRTLEPDKTFIAPDGAPLVLQGRSLLFVRNVGHLMTAPALLLADGTEAPEGILDGIMTSLIALYDIRGLGRVRNSRTGSILKCTDPKRSPSRTACWPLSSRCWTLRPTPSKSG